MSYYDEDEEQMYRREVQEQVRNQVLREQEERAREYEQGQHSGRVNYTRRRSLDLMLEAETSQFQKMWMRRNVANCDDDDDDDDDDDVDPEEEQQLLEAKRIAMLEESERRYNTMEARRLADQEQARRVAEWEAAEQDQYESAIQREHLQHYIDELVRQEHQEQIAAYEQGADQRVRSFARRKSIDFMVEMEGKKPRDAIEAKQETARRENSTNEHMERSERRRRSVVARDLATLEQLRRMQEFSNAELEEMSPEEREELLQAVQMEQAERVQDYEQGKDLPTREFARRQSLTMMLEAQGDAFQRKWAQHNNDEDSDYAEDEYVREQDELARAEKYELAIAESDRRQNMMLSVEAADAEQERRITASSPRPYENTAFAQVQKQTVRAARRRSIVKDVLPRMGAEPEPSQFEHYKEWAEQVMASMQDEINFQSNKIEMLSQYHDSAVDHMESLNNRLESAQDQFEWDQRNLDAREQQLQVASGTLDKLQDHAGDLEVMLEGSMLQLHESREVLASERQERAKVENMLENALLELEQAKRQLRAK